MIDPVPADLNLKNLEYVFSRIKHLEAFVFFGTILGYVREGNIIENDDDVDIYVNIRHRRALKRALANSDLEMRYWPRRGWLRNLFTKGNPYAAFAQGVRYQNGIPTYVDFYFYDATPDAYISERWNFSGDCKDPRKSMHTPKDYIFPLQAASMQGVNIQIPAKPDKVCEFLYGVDWKVPARKATEYTIEVQNHKPVFIKH